MSRQLTALEKYRITGVHDAREQIAVFKRLGIPTTTRLSMGNYIIECIAHTGEVRDCINAAQWSEIRDENIDTAYWLMNQRQDHAANNTHIENPQTTESLTLFDIFCPEQRKKRA